MRAIFYPPANRTAAWYDRYPGVDMGGIDKLLLHSTEDGGWPAYDGGALRPTLTYHPVLRAWRQHGRLDYSARALQDPTSTPVRENRDKVCQVEIVGTCDPIAHKANPKWPFMPALTDGQLDDLADLFAFLHEEWGTPLQAVPLWLPYPASFGPSRARLTGQQYDNWTGLLGHEHAPGQRDPNARAWGNDHGDPGNIDAHGITVRAQLIVTPPPAPVTPAPTTEDEDDMHLRTYGGKTYLFWGMFRREVAPEDVASAAAEFGPAQPATRQQMNLRTPLDTVLRIQSETRTDVADIDTATAAAAVAVATITDQLGEVLDRLPPPVAPTTPAG